MLNCLILNLILPLIVLLVYGKSYGYEGNQKSLIHSVRPVLCFNNPNQLGFFSFVNLSLMFYIILLVNDLDLKLNKLKSMFILYVNALFLFLSVSRAIQPALIIFFYSNLLLYNNKLMKQKPKIIFIFIMVLCFCASALIYYNHYILSLNSNNIKIMDQTFLEELYSRNFSGLSYNFFNGFILFFGSDQPYSPAHGNLEFHNNFLSLFNTVGLLGLTMYLFLVKEIFIDLKQKGFLYLLPFFCYLGVSEMHFVFRPRDNWLFFAMIIFTLHVRKKLVSMK
jgi:hypothetical protein